MRAVDETLLLPTPPCPTSFSQPASYACHYKTDVVEQIDVYLSPQQWYSS